MNHTRRKVNITAKLRKGAWKIQDDYTGFDTWSDEVAFDRVGFVTQPKLADPVNADDNPPKIPKQQLPDVVSTSTTPRLSDSAELIYGDS